MTIFDILNHKFCGNLYKNCIKTLKNRKFRIFCLFRCQFQIFFTPQIDLRKSLLDNKFLPWWHFSALQSTKSVKILAKIAWKHWKVESFVFFVYFGINLFSIPIHEVCRSLDKNSIKTWKIENFEIFVIFGVNFLEKTVFISIEGYRTTNACLVERFQHSNLRSLFKTWQKLHKKRWKLGNFWIFVIFRVILGHYGVIFVIPKSVRNFLQIHIARS